VLWNLPDIDSRSICVICLTKEKLPNSGTVIIRNRINYQQMVDRSSPNYDSNMSAEAEEERMVGLLPADFVPGKWDVICQRGKECFDHGK
jgi:hypothetical protein